MCMSKIQVMLADDHDLVRKGFCKILESEDDIVVIGEASNGKSLLKEIASGARPDVVLMDIQMPVMTGIEATQRLRELAPNIPVIGLTAGDEDGVLEEKMRHAGARDYMIKSSKPSELVRKIREVHHHKARIPSKQHKRMPPIDEDSSMQEQLIQQLFLMEYGLTRRELEVMRVLVHGLSNKEIARKLTISERTVQTHLSNIFHKIRVNSRTEAVLAAVKYGWETPI